MTMWILSRYAMKCVCDICSNLTLMLARTLSQPCIWQSTTRHNTAMSTNVRLCQRHETRVLYVATLRANKVKPKAL